MKMERKQLKPKYSDPGYWRDWYWNRGGREKVQANVGETQVVDVLFFKPAEHEGK